MVGPDGDDWTVDRLFRNDPEAVPFICAKFRINRRRYRSGDVPPRPRTLVELADMLGWSQEVVRERDHELVLRMARNRALSSPRLAFFHWPVELAPALWDREYGMAYDERGRLRRKSR